MNRDDIKKAAREAGFWCFEPAELETILLESGTREITKVFDAGVAEGAANEREACARIAEECLVPVNWDEIAEHMIEDYDIAAAIRARGDQ